MPSTRGRAVVLAALVLTGLAASAGAAATVAAVSHLHVGVRAPPVAFEQGPGASSLRHVEGFSLSLNKTSFSLTLKPKPGAGLVVKDLARVSGASEAAREVTLRGEAVDNARVESFTWTIRNGTTVVAVLNHKAASPSATFTLPAGARYALDLGIDLAEGAGQHNARAPFGLRLEVS